MICYKGFNQGAAWSYEKKRGRESSVLEDGSCTGATGLLYRWQELRDDCCTEHSHHTGRCLEKMGQVDGIWEEAL